MRMLVLIVSVVVLGCDARRSADDFDRSARESAAARRWTEAEVAAERALLLDPGYRFDRDMIVGAAAFARSVVSEAAAEMPNAAPALFDAAIRQAQAAREAFDAARRSRPDMQAARRNLERAVRRIDMLTAKRREAEEARRNAPKRPRPVPKEGGSGEKGTEIQGTTDATIEIAIGDAPDGAKSVLERVARGQADKRAGRLERRVRSDGTVERDW
jgi:hypothetical protein